MIRSVLAALTSEGRVVKQPRRGMFVAPQATEVRFMTSTLGVFDDLSERGYKVTVKTFDLGLYPANDHERRVFNLPVGFEVFRALRVYMANGIPLTHTHISLPAHRLPGIELMDIENRSITSSIRERFGLTILRADRWLTASAAPAEVAERMGIAEGTPMIVIDSVAYDHDGNALECYHAYYRADVAPIHISAE